MSYQEKENIVNIVSALLITPIYALIIYRMHLEGRFDLTEDFRQWGIIFLIFMGVSVVARIIIYIIFHIINAIATREQEMPVKDERDKLIKLKATRNAHYTFFSIFMLSVISLAIGLPVYWIFVLFVVSSMMSEIVDNVSQIHYHRKGISNG